MTFITDRKHLAAIIQNGMAALLDLQDAWLAEDRAACAPTSGSSVSVSGGGWSDPTSAIAERDRYRDRDRIGGLLITTVRQLEQAVERRKPRKVTGWCACCDDRTATHGEGDDGNPTDCFWCWRFLRKHGVRCDADAHEAFPAPPKFCSCPPQCCAVCGDPPAEGRTVSERCKKRRDRGVW